MNSHHDNWYIVQIIGTDGVRMVKMVQADNASIAESMVINEIPESRRDWIQEVNSWVSGEQGDELADTHYFGTP